MRQRFSHLPTIILMAAPGLPGMAMERPPTAPGEGREITGPTTDGDAAFATREYVEALHAMASAGTMVRTSAPRAQVAMAGPLEALASHRKKAGGLYRLQQGLLAKLAPPGQDPPDQAGRTRIRTALEKCEKELRSLFLFEGTTLIPAAQEVFFQAFAGFRRRASGSAGAHRSGLRPLAEDRQWVAELRNMSRSLAMEWDAIAACRPWTQWRIGFQEKAEAPFLVELLKDWPGGAEAEWPAFVYPQGASWSLNPPAGLAFADAGRREREAARLAGIDLDWREDAAKPAGTAPEPRSEGKGEARSADSRKAARAKQKAARRLEVEARNHARNLERKRLGRERAEAEARQREEMKRAAEAPIKAQEEAAPRAEPEAEADPGPPLRAETQDRSCREYEEKVLALQHDPEAFAAWQDELLARAMEGLWGVRPTPRPGPAFRDPSQFTEADLRRNPAI